MPLLTVGARTRGVVKTVLVPCGVIATNSMRQHAGSPLDGHDRQELDADLADLADLFRLAVP